MTQNANQKQQLNNKAERNHKIKMGTYIHTYMRQHEATE